MSEHSPMAELVQEDDQAQATDVKREGEGAATEAAAEAADKKCCGLRMSIWKTLRVAFLAVMLILVQTLQVVSFKKAGYSFGPYPYMILILVSFAFVPLFGVAAWIIACRTGGFVPEITTCSFKKHFFIIGIFNALNGILIIFSNPHVSGVLQSILAQAVIPFTLVLSILWLRTKYAVFQYIGAFIVIGGVGVSLIPTFESTPNSTDPNATMLGLGDDFDSMDDEASVATGDSGGGGVNQGVIWAIIFTLGQLPQALGSIYQEKVFVATPHQINVVYMLAWASLAQFVMLAAAFPINFVPWFGAVNVQDAGAYLHNATSCLVNGAGSAPQCDEAFLDICYCVVTMLLTNVVQTLLVKYSSAVLSVFVITLVTPVSAFAFTLHFLMGDDVETVNLLEIVALVVLMVGIFIYRGRAILATFKKKKNAAKKSSRLSEKLLDVEEGSDLEYQPEPFHEDDGLEDAPVLLNSRAGIINSEFTAEGVRDVPFFLAGTQRARSRSLSRDARSQQQGRSHSMPPAETKPIVAATYGTEPALSKGYGTNDSEMVTNQTAYSQPRRNSE
eukprot:INCI9559.1.p1 GENE.INCI9559.1~~INCI9559.1.p1  ORF type:complete len:559 (+),score=99.69 INCI9559.1:169-1845(+)